MFPAKLIERAIVHQRQDFAFAGHLERPCLGLARLKLRGEVLALDLQRLAVPRHTPKLPIRIELPLAHKHRAALESPAVRLLYGIVNRHERLAKVTVPPEDAPAVGVDLHAAASRRIAARPDETHRRTNRNLSPFGHRRKVIGRGKTEPAVCGINHGNRRLAAHAPAGRIARLELEPIGARVKRHLARPRPVLDLDLARHGLHAVQPLRPVVLPHDGQAFLQPKAPQHAFRRRHFPPVQRIERDRRRNGVPAFLSVRHANLAPPRDRPDQHRHLAAACLARQVGHVGHDRETEAWLARPIGP